MYLIDVVVKFRDTYAPLVAEDPRLLGIYTKKLKEFQELMQDECLKNTVLSEQEIMDYMMDETEFLHQVARIKMSSMY